MGEVTFEEIVAAVEGGATTRRPDVKIEPRFKVGDVVRVKKGHPSHHTRSTRYSRGKTGEVVKAHGVFVYPDTNSEWQGEDPQHVYTVCFSAREIWGEDGVDGDSLCLDLWEPYLEQP
ncbi:MAG: SH3-like domain-containing protein [Pseudomonadota bacterium]